MSLLTYKYASPRHFYHLAGRLIPWLAGLTGVLLAVGIYFGLFVAPADYQQGESYRIMFVHVPAAWLSMFVYMMLAGAGAVGLVWNIKLADMMATASAPIGASFTFLALVTGSLWGKPMWGDLVGMGRASNVGAALVLFVCGIHGLASGHRRPAA